MKTLLVLAEHILLASFIFDLSNPLKHDNDKSTDCLKPVANILKTQLEHSAAVLAGCAACLKTYDTTTLLQKWKIEADEEAKHTFDTDFLGKLSGACVEVIVDWVHALSIQQGPRTSKRLS